MKADLRISIKDYRRNKSLKVTLLRVPYAQRQFLVRMDGKPDFRMCDERSALTPDRSPPGEGEPAGVRHAGDDGVAQGAGAGGVNGRPGSRAVTAWHAGSGRCFRGADAPADGREERTDVYGRQPTVGRCPKASTDASRQSGGVQKRLRTLADGREVCKSVYGRSPTVGRCAKASMDASRRSGGVRKRGNP